MAQEKKATNRMNAEAPLENSGGSTANLLARLPLLVSSLGRDRATLLGLVLIGLVFARDNFLFLGFILIMAWTLLLAKRWGLLD